MKKIIFALSVIIILNACVEDPPLSEITESKSGVVLFINEINPTGSPDWVEIYNPNNFPVDMEGFSISDPGNTYIIPSGISILANGFLIFYCDDTGTGNHTNFKLSSGGEGITVKDVNGKIVDQVNYPALNDGESYGRETDGGTNFMVFSEPTLGASNETNENKPDISKISVTPGNPKISDTIVIRVKTTKADPEKVFFYYSTNTTNFTEIKMDQSVSDTNLFIARLSPFSNEVTVQYYILAFSYTNDQVKDPPGTDYHSFSVLSGSKRLFINEVLTTGSPDWMELYNASGQSIDLSGYYVYDDGTKTNKYRLPDGTTILSKGYLVLFCDDGNNGLHTNFRLSSGGESVYLENENETLIDQVIFPTLNNGESYGRKPDGSNVFQKFTIPTQGSSNG